MSDEIERKFLLNKPLNEILAEHAGATSHVITQQYLGETGKWTTRIRNIIEDGKSSFLLAFKRKVSDIRCNEVEDEISEKMYRELAEHCGPAIMKTRYEIRENGHVWQIDQFHNPEFEGLVVAEVELINEDQELHRPHWLGQEVSHDKSYKNAKMVQRLV